MRTLAGIVLLLAVDLGTCFDIKSAFRDVASAIPSFGAPQIASKTPVVGVENGVEGYPWQFTGRLWFRPALVRVPKPASSDAGAGAVVDGNEPPPPPPSVSILSLFGWTVGGVVALEYDDSPVGPYFEYVTMGALVSKRGALGQWGSKLYVSTDVAQQVCEEVWGVPATRAEIDFTEESNDGEGKVQVLCVESAPQGTKSERQDIVVSGWGSTRISGVEDADCARYPPGGLPVLWTPTIKALWAPLVPFPSSDDDKDELPLHRLRLSASGVRLRLCGQPNSDELGIPLGVGLVVDNVLIEIARRGDSL
uniref:Uncharacterized protein n=1 Tax=Odontella aurita TaxID=265563 RepID=A0A7S4JT39_9STRA|mmetsp:Transcript_53577/g.160350  ORF Transcript_53577/g.160350 Transcript_53577/m.160350 type:complete len:308 (+) Transcript_53577:208-1131(+)